jgi:hypothetical protein
VDDVSLVPKGYRKLGALDNAQDSPSFPPDGALTITCTVCGGVPTPIASVYMPEPAWKSGRRATCTFPSHDDGVEADTDEASRDKSGAASASARARPPRLLVLPLERRIFVATENRCTLRGGLRPRRASAGYRA